MSELDRAAISARIHRARTESGMTQQELADAMQVHWPVQQWEREDAKAVPFDRLDELGAVTGKTKRWFLHGEAEVADVDQLAEIVRRLEALEVLVSKLPTKPQLQRGLDALREAIDTQANRGTHRGSSRRTATGP